MYSTDSSSVPSSMSELNYYTGDSQASAAMGSMSSAGGSAYPHFYSNPGHSSSPSGSSLISSSSSSSSSMLMDHEAPLLEELGIYPYEILRRTLAVALPFRSLPPVDESDSDLAGPFCFCLALGCCLLLAGKIHFGYIYGFGVISCLLMYILVNLMCDAQSISIDRTASILGYALVPLVALAALVIFIDCRGAIGLSCTVLIIAWCAINATRMFEKSLDMREQRYLIAYPAAIIYACFALLTIF